MNNWTTLHFSVTPGWSCNFQFIMENATIFLKLVIENGKLENGKTLVKQTTNILIKLSLKCCFPNTKFKKFWEKVKKLLKNPWNHDKDKTTSDYSNGSNGSPCLSNATKHTIDQRFWWVWVSKQKWRNLKIINKNIPAEYPELGEHFEGDIILTPEQEAMILSKTGLKDLRYRWPDNTVPYLIVEEGYSEYHLRIFWSNSLNNLLQQIRNRSILWRTPWRSWKKLPAWNSFHILLKEITFPSRMRSPGVSRMWEELGVVKPSTSRPIE